MQSLSPQLARSVLDAAPDALIVIDASGTIQFANRQVSALFGYAHDELIGKPVEWLLPERFRERHPALRHAYGGNVRVRPMGAGLNLSGRRADGSEFPVEISLSPIDDAGRLLVAAAIRDVTERRRVEAELGTQLEDMRRLHELSTRLVEATELRRILDEMLDAAIALQKADFGVIQLCDPETGVLRIVAQRGFSADFLGHFASVGVNDDSACGRAFREASRVIIEDIEKDRGHLPHLAIATREGYRAVQSTPIHGRDGSVLGMLSTHFRRPQRPPDRVLQMTDIYLRLVSELINRARNDEALRSARDLANRANQAKSRFLATASHDLRQPLQTLSLLNGTLRRMPANPIGQQALAQQEQAITAMSRLLNALLDISKLEAGAIRPDPSDFTVRTLFEELRQEFSELAGAKGLRLDVAPCDDWVHTDLSLVGQVLRNLVANAIKYTREGWVALRCLHDQPAFVRIEVVDTGIGIPRDQLRYIYDEFFQVGVAANTTREGYGLGLSIVQRIVALLDVRLDVQSEVGRGSMFALTLPVSQGASRAVPRHAPEPVRPAGRRRARVLLVEDEPAVLNATRMLLASEGYEVRVAAAVPEALEVARQDPDIDLLVTDYHLGEGQTGTQAIASLRLALHRPLKAVLMTGDTSSAVRDLPRDALLRTVSKPVNADELLSIIEALLDS